MKYFSLLFKDPKNTIDLIPGNIRCIWKVRDAFPAAVLHGLAHVHVHGPASGDFTQATQYFHGVCMVASSP